MPKSDSVLYMVSKYASLAMLLPASTFVGYVIGYLLDRWLATGFLKIVFLILGIASGFLSLIRELSREAKRIDSGKP